MAETNVMGNVISGSTGSTTSAEPKTKDTTTSAKVTSPTSPVMQPTQSVQYGTTRYSPSQKFEVTPSGEVKVVPLAGGKEGGVLYSQLPASAQAQLESKGIISGQGAAEGFGRPVTAPSGKVYTGTGFAKSPTGEFASRYIVTQLPSVSGSIMPTNGSAISSTTTQNLSLTSDLPTEIPPIVGIVQPTTGPIGLNVSTAPLLLTTPQGKTTPDESKKISKGFVTITGTAAAKEPMTKGTEPIEEPWDINKALSKITGADEKEPAVKPLVSVSTTLPSPPTGKELKAKDILIRPAEEQRTDIREWTKDIEGKELGKGTFLRGETKEGDVRFVPVPFTESEFLKASIKEQPHEKFVESVMAEAGKVYDVEASQIAAKGEIPQPKEEYLTQVKGTLTPEYQKKLIMEQYVPKAVEFVTKDTQGKELPAYTRGQVAAIFKEEDITQFFKGELEAGRIPKLAEIPMAIYVGPTSQAIGGGIAKGLGYEQLGTEFQQAAVESEARTFAKASIRGQEGPVGLIKFGLESLPETYTGIAGLTIGGGQIAGAGLKLALPKIATTGGKVGQFIAQEGGPTAAKVTSKIGAGAKWLGEETVLHPTITRVALGSIPVATESWTVSERFKAGESLPQIVSETTKEAVGLAGFTYGFHAGYQQGYPIKLVRTEIPVSEEAKLVTKTVGGKQMIITQTPKGAEVKPTKLGFGLEYETGGKSRYLFSYTEPTTGGVGWKFGGPKFETAPKGLFIEEYLPKSGGEAQFVKAAYGVPKAAGGVPLEVAKMSAIQEVMGSVEKGPAPVKPTEFKAESKYFQELASKGKITPAQAKTLNKALSDTVKAQAKKYIEVYGTTAQKLQSLKGTARTPRDVDITYRGREQETIAAANRMKNELNAVVKAEKIKGVTFQTGKENPKLVEMVVKGEKTRHVIDVHSAFEPTPDVIQARSYGFSLEPKTMKVEAVPTSILSKETLRKSSSVGTLRPVGTAVTTKGTLTTTPFQVGPEAPQRAKDIAGVTQLAKNIQAGYTMAGKTAAAERVGKAVETYVQTFGPKAIPLSETTAEPLFAFRSVASGVSAATVGSTVGAAATKGFKVSSWSPPTSLEARVGYPSAPSKPISATPSKPSVSMSAASKSLGFPSASMPSRELPSQSLRAASKSMSESPAQQVSYPSASSFRSSIKSPPSSVSSKSPSLSSSSLSSYPSPSSSKGPSPPSPYSPYLSSVSASLSQSVSSVSGSSSLSKASASLSASGMSLGPTRFGGGGGGGAKGESATAKKEKYFAPKMGKQKETFGIISEGISKQLFGKATFKAGIGTAGSSPTAELQKAGITSPAAFFERGGYVDLGKRATEIKASVGSMTGSKSAFKTIRDLR